jgi:hypothetical protein
MSFDIDDNNEWAAGFMGWEKRGDYYEIPEGMYMGKPLDRISVSDYHPTENIGQAMALLDKYMGISNCRNVDITYKKDTTRIFLYGWGKIKMLSRAKADSLPAAIVATVRKAVEGAKEK